MIRTHAARHDVARWLTAGALFGMVAGAVFILFEMAVDSIRGAGFWMPLRMIGGIPIGEEAMEPGYSLGAAAGAGAVVHMGLSALFGATFAAFAWMLRGRAAIVAAASAFGLALWLVNFYAIAPIAFPWFENADPLVQFVAHTFFFGTTLGLFLTAVRRPELRFDERAAEEPLREERAEAVRARGRIRERV
jgi:hypothetical protein